MPDSQLLKRPLCWLVSHRWSYYPLYSECARCGRQRHPGNGRNGAAW